MNKSMLLAGLAALGLLAATTGARAGNIQSCTEPNCGATGEVRYSKSVVTFKRAAPQTSTFSQPKMLQGESLSGELSGNWDSVAGIITFPWQADADLSLQLVALSLPAQSSGNGQYTATGWQRELFFLDFGDGVPRLLSSNLLEAEFTPQPGDVIDQPGQLWISQYALYQEAEELTADADFYAGYAEGAAMADIRFVANDAGEVLQIAIDIYDDAGTYQYSVEPQAGDRINPSFIAYDLQQPDILYALYYFDQLKAITNAMTLQRSYYVPRAINDSALPEGFDSADLNIAVLFEGVKTIEGESSFAYGPLTDLGYRWGEAKQSTASASGGSSGALMPGLLVLLAGLGLHARRKRRGTI